MRIILDNCMPRRAKALFSGHEAEHTAELGWARLRNGGLLAKAAERFDLFVTVDKNLRYQQNLEKLPLPVLELNVASNRFKDLEALATFLPKVLEKTAHHRFVSLSRDGATEALSPRSLKQEIRRETRNLSEPDREPER